MAPRDEGRGRPDGTPRKPLRLQRALARAGVTSRRKAEELIRAGRVRVDGAVATIGMSIDPGRQRVSVDGRAVHAAGGGGGGWAGGGAGWGLASVRGFGGWGCVGGRGPGGGGGAGGRPRGWRSTS